LQQWHFTIKRTCNSLPPSRPQADYQVLA